MNCLRIFAFLLLPTLLWAETYHPFDYKSGFSTIQSLGQDIYNSLEPNERSMFGPNPISVDSSRKPSVRLLYFVEGKQTIRGVWISQGFVDLVNHVAHAQAIDKKRRGYFARYIEALELSEDSVPPLPDRDNPEFWTDSVLNEQLSNFNSIVGITVGISLAQHYLGYYDKYEDRLKSADGETILLNHLLTSEEWERSYRRGLNNAMHASCMTEGYLPFCEALSSMKRRPSWVGHFLPNTAKFSAMRKDMVKLQHKFLND